MVKREKRVDSYEKRYVEKVDKFNHQLACPA